MLVLTRRQGEEIVIGENVHVTVLSVDGTRVRLGLTAPKDVSILRGELNSRGERAEPRLLGSGLPPLPNGRGSDESAVVAHSPHD